MAGGVSGAFSIAPETFLALRTVRSDGGGVSGAPFGAGETLLVHRIVGVSGVAFATTELLAHKVGGVSRG
jgi:hypothetical protein